MASYPCDPLRLCSLRKTVTFLCTLQRRSLQRSAEAIGFHL